MDTTLTMLEKTNPINGSNLRFPGGVTKRLHQACSILFASFLTIFFLLVSSNAWAALELSLVPVKGTVTQGGTTTFRATVRNTGASAIRLNQISVTFDNGDQVDIDPTGFYDKFEGELAAGASVTVQTLFAVTAEPTATPATYNGTVQILGGSTMDSLDNLAQKDFSLDITANAGPPETFFTEGPDNNGVTGITEVTFGFTGSDSETPTAQLRYRYRLDNEAWKETTETRIKLTGLTYATHTFAVAAVDSANVADPTPAERTFKVEKPKLIVAAPDVNTLRLIPNQPQAVTIRLTNLSKLTLTNITAIIEGTASNIVITPGSLPATLGPETGVDVTLTVTAKSDAILSSKPTVTLKSAENEEGLISFDLTVVPQRPQLVLTPANLNAAMLRGQQTLVEAELSNTGNVAATNVKVNLPSVPWMSLITPQTVDKIDPGTSVKVGLSLLPGASLTLGPYQGNLAINGDNGGVSLPFLFNCISNNKGSLRLIAEDEYTYFADGKPRLNGVKITLKDRLTGAVIAEGTTGAVENQGQGVLILENITEGFYDIEATADKHGSFKGVVEVVGGDTREFKPFLPRQLVTYTWNVVPVDTEDKYEVTLEATFETHVPAPVVTIAPMVIDLTKLSYDDKGETIVYYTITNHGLIAANTVTLSFDGDSKYTGTPQTSDFGTLGPLQTVVVAVKFKKRSGFSGANGGPSIRGADTGRCGFAGRLFYSYECGGTKNAGTTPSCITGDCPGGGSSYIGGLFGAIGGFISDLIVPPAYAQEDPCCDCKEVNVQMTRPGNLKVGISATVLKCDGTTTEEHDRKVHLRARVTPAKCCKDVKIRGTGHISIVNETRNCDTGIIDFDVLGDTPSTDPFDSKILVSHPCGFTGEKKVSVVVPGDWACPVVQGKTVVETVKAGDLCASPKILGTGDVNLIYRIQKIRIVDQFGDDIGDIYAGAFIYEDYLGPIGFINQTLKADSTFEDPVGRHQIVGQPFPYGKEPAPSFYVYVDKQWKLRTPMIRTIDIQQPDKVNVIYEICNE